MSALMAGKFASTIRISSASAPANVPAGTPATAEGLLSKLASCRSISASSSLMRFASPLFNPFALVASLTVSRVVSAVSDSGGNAA